MVDLPLQFMQFLCDILPGVNAGEDVTMRACKKEIDYILDYSLVLNYAVLEIYNSRKI